MMDIFDACHTINDLMIDGDKRTARDELIKLLAHAEQNNLEYPPYLNELIRSTGLFPYMKPENATWDQRYVHKVFAVDVGSKEVTLHREQSLVLRKLLEGKDLAISAPTSFGKSFIIDAFIAEKRPSNVVIIVPTIALMDETRRRLFKKFSTDYNIVTAPETRLQERNILIFPQERVFGYLKKLEKIDFLVVDEFYKISLKHDKDRAPALMKAILKLSAKSAQKYCLAPNIKRLGENVFTSGMEFLELLEFNTVFLEKHDFSQQIAGDIEKKRDHLLSIVADRKSKTLIYAGTYKEVSRVGQILADELTPVERPLTLLFSTWLRQNYKNDWSLASLIERGVGVHNGQMHRCLTQIQIRLFELEDGFDSIVSTSSIIEGVNTSAENIVVWRSRLGVRPLQDFTYKNIIGRGGRMFKHFIGKIYLFEPPPEDQDNQLEIELPDSVLGSLSDSWERIQLTPHQIEKIRTYRDTMVNLVGQINFNRLQDSEVLNDPDADFILKLTRSMREHPEEWRGFGYLNSANPEDWSRILFKLINLKPGAWDGPFGDIVSVTKIISRNWDTDLPIILKRLERIGIGIDKFFKVERAITFKLAALVSDANELHKTVIDKRIDVSRFVARLSNAFLPKAVYNLEEFGLPRMISKKIHRSGLIDFEADECDLAFAIKRLKFLGASRVLSDPALTEFDKYIVEYFFDGITLGSAD